MLSSIMGFMLAAWIAAPIVLFVCSTLVRFWTRGESSPNYCYRLQRKKYEFFFENAGDVGFWCFISWVTMDLVLIPLLWIGLYSALSYFPFQTVVCLISMVALLFVPRFLNDLKGAFKWNCKERDSDRIKELERKINQLEKKR